MNSVQRKKQFNRQNYYRGLYWPNDYGVGRLAADISSTSVAKTNNQKDGDYARVFKHDVSNSSVQTVLRKRW